MPLIVIGVAITLNVVLLIGLVLMVPRWLQRRDVRTSDEATHLRALLLDVLNEQEGVALRQGQIGLTLAALNRDVERVAETVPLTPRALAEAAGLPQLEHRLEALQQQLAAWQPPRPPAPPAPPADSQSWGHLLSLLATMQDRIAVLNTAVQRPYPPHHATERLFQELEAEMQHLRTLADDVASLQWKLRRGVLERETHLAALRSQLLAPSGYTKQVA